MDGGVDMDGLSGSTLFSGLLEKVTKTVFKSKKKIMCVLTDREFLLYADNKAQGSPRSINLQDIQAVKRVNPSKGYHIELITKQKTEIFATDSLDLCHQWIKALQTAILNKRRTSSVSVVSDPVPNRQSFSKGHAYETVDLDKDDQSPQIKNVDREALPDPPNPKQAQAHMYETVDLDDSESPQIIEQSSRPLCGTVDANNGPYAVAYAGVPVSQPLCETVDTNDGPYSRPYDEKIPITPPPSCKLIPDIVVYSEPENLKQSDLYKKSKAIHNTENKNGLHEDKKKVFEDEDRGKSVQIKSLSDDKTVNQMTCNEAYCDVRINGSDKLYSEIDPSQQTEALKDNGNVHVNVYSLAGDPDRDHGSVPDKTVKSASAEKVEHIASDRSSEKFILNSNVETNVSDGDSRSEKLITPVSIGNEGNIRADRETVAKSSHHDDLEDASKQVYAYDTQRGEDRGDLGDHGDGEVFDDIMNAKLTPIMSLAHGPLKRDDAIVQLDTFLRECRGYSAMYSSVVKKDSQTDGQSVVKNLREFFSASTKGC